MNENLLKILFIRPDAIGDSLLAASMLQSIKNKFANHEIVVLCQRSVSDIYRYNPNVSDIITLNKKQFVEDNAYKKELLSELKSHQFDIVLNTVYSRELSMEKLVHDIGAKKTIGFFVTNQRGRWDFTFRYNNQYDQLVKYNGNEYDLELDKYLFLLKELNINISHPLLPTIYWSQEDDLYAEKILSENNLLDKKIIILFAGAQSKHRLFYGYGKALAEYGFDSQKYILVLLGAEQDMDINEKNGADSKLSTINLCGKTTITQAAALMARATFGLGTETGLAHLAAAVKLPHVIIIGGGHFGRFMPYSEKTSLVANPITCYRCNWKCPYSRTLCIQNISNAPLIRALEEVLLPSNVPRIYVENFKQEHTKQIPSKSLQSLLLYKNATISLC